MNYAMYLRSLFDKVLIADLDVVNPYFHEGQRRLAAARIHLISPEFANTNVDLPALPTEMYAIVDRTDYHAVVDVGGDDSGAVALGRYVRGYLKRTTTKCCSCAAIPPSRKPRRCARRNRDRGGVRIPFTAIADNSNLGDETTAKDIESSAEYVSELSALCGLDVKFVSARHDIAPDVRGRAAEVFPLRLQKKYYDIKEG
ncbi:MAG: hypothetical protein ACLUFM_01130 [Lachnospiraceae bacterium]